MTTFWIDLLIGFWLLLFGGMALLPILTGGASRHQREEAAEDRVISIAPARTAPARPTGSRMPLVPDGDRQERRTAA